MSDSSDKNIGYGKKNSHEKPTFSSAKIVGDGSTSNSNESFLIDGKPDEKSRIIALGNRFFDVITSGIDWIGFYLARGDKNPDLMARIKAPMRLGMMVLLLFLGVFGIWGSIAPLEGAVVALGQVNAFSKRKIIQHLEGGIIEKILIKEGDKVEMDQPLIELNNVTAKSQIGILVEKLHLFKTTARRLRAERDDKEPDFSDIIHDNDKTHDDAERINNIIDSQKNLFHNRRKNVTGQIFVLENRIEQSNNELEGLESQIISVKEQARFTMEELEAKRKLLSSGSISRPAILALEKQQVILIGTLGEYNAKKAQVNQKIGETELEIINVKNRFKSEVNNELKEIDASVSDLKERILSSQDILMRTVIRAPQEGFVTSLKYHTIGGVIAPGAEVAEIAPANDIMVIDAKVMPNDIERLLESQHNKDLYIDVESFQGVKVKINITAVNARKVGMLNGVLKYVSADVLSDPRTGVQYYSAQVMLPKAEIANVSHDLTLYPGMPATVYIVTQSRTFLSYLLSPILYTIDNSFLER